MTKVILILGLLTSSFGFAGTTDVGSVEKSSDFALENSDGCRGQGLLEPTKITLNMSQSQNGWVGITIFTDHKKGVIHGYCDGETVSAPQGNILELTCGGPANGRGEATRGNVIIEFDGIKIKSVLAIGQVKVNGEWKSSVDYYCRNLTMTVKPH